MQTLMMVGNRLNRQGWSAFGLALLPGLALCLLIGFANGFDHRAIWTVGIGSLAAAVFVQKYWLRKREALEDD